MQQHGVEQAVVADDALQGIDAQQEGRPERQDDDQQQNVLRRLGGARDGVGHRVAEREADQGREERGPQRVQVGVPVHLVGEQILVVCEGSGRAADGAPAVRVRISVKGGTRAATLGEADLEGERERDEKEHQQKQQRRQDDQPAARALQRVS